MKSKATSAGSPASRSKSASADSPKTAPARPARLFTHEEISERARSLWEQRGRPEGRDEEIWLEAERQLKQGELAATEERRFANPDALLDADGDPNDAIDKRLDEIAQPRAGRSATSL